MKTIQLPAIPVRFAADSDDGYLLLRMWWRWVECAYVSFRRRGLQAEVEFPSDWHEHRMGWVRISFGFVTIAVGFPWKWVVPDEGQCSGPRYGFAFHGDALWLHFGKMTGRSRGPKRYRVWDMPWAWRHRQHEVLGEPEQHPYRYVLRSGEIQDRIATIKPERRLWTRPWLPHKRESRCINIDFNNEVGEGAGSWKGGVMSCSAELLPDDKPVDALRRMERERRFER